MEVNLDLIADICKKYTDLNLHKVYLGCDVSSEMILNAVQGFPLTNAKTMYLLYDSSTFGTSNSGIAICDNGVFYKNNIFNRPCYKYFPWEEFSGFNIYINGSNIFFGNEYHVHFPTAITTVKAMEKLFKEIQQSLQYEGEKDKNEEETAPIDKNQKISKNENIWHLAIDGKQYGPMDIFEIRRRIIDRFFIPERTFVWKQGMENWELFNNISELRGIKEELNKSTIKQHVVSNFNKSTKIGAKKKIDINTCQFDDLLSIDCIDLNRANYIFEKRQNGKKFYAVKDIEELLKLKPHEVEELKGKVEFNLSRMLKGVRRVEF